MVKHKITNKKIADLGSCWCVTLNKRDLKRKGFEVGEMIDLEISHTESDDELLQKLAAKKLYESNAKNADESLEVIFSEAKEKEDDDDNDKPPKT